VIEIDRCSGDLDQHVEKIGELNWKIIRTTPLFGPRIFYVFIPCIPYKSQTITALHFSMKADDNKTKLNSVALFRERTIPTERPPPVGEVSANFCG